MLPKTESEMFSKSLVDQKILMIVPKKLLPDYDRDYKNEDGVPPLLDGKGEEWVLMGLLWVKNDAVFIGDVDENGIPIINDDPEGFFIEVDNYATKGVWDSRVIRDLIEEKGVLDDLEWFLSQYVINRYQWRYIFPAELYNVHFPKPAINYQQIQ
jgi:hypothetical protein